MRSLADIIGASVASRKRRLDARTASPRREWRIPGALRAGALLAGIGFSGCPNPEARFDEFVERASRLDMAHEMPDAAPSRVYDVTGQFLLSIGNVVVNPDARLQFIGDTKLTPKDDGTATLDLSIRPLDYMTRMALSDAPIVSNGNVVNADGTFRVPLGRVMVGAMANAISGSPIVADLTLVGTIRSADRFCGGVEGMAIMPLMIPLNDALWAGVRIPSGTMGAALPAPDISCVAGPEPDAGAEEMSGPVDAASPADMAVGDAAADLASHD